MQTMSLIDALTLVHSTLQECTVPLRDAVKAGGAMNLLNDCIGMLRQSAATEKEDEQC